MIEFLVEQWRTSWAELTSFLGANFHGLWDTVDILVVSVGLYWLLLLIRGTRAVQILVGLMALIAARVVADSFELTTVSWILDNFLASAVLIIIVLFQGDIRRALAQVGRGFFPRLAAREESQVLEEIIRAAQTLSQKRVGALIVIERETGLEDLVDGGTRVDAVVTKELLTSIFLPYSPIHDGAVIIRNGRIVEAGCVLPLATSTDLPEGLGTRHRAAVGITQETDALVVVVSEETSAISVAFGGALIRDLDAPRLRGVLRVSLGLVVPDDDDDDDRPRVVKAEGEAEAKAAPERRDAAADTP